MSNHLCLQHVGRDAVPRGSPATAKTCLTLRYHIRHYIFTIVMLKLITLLPEAEPVSLHGEASTSKQHNCD